MGKSPCSARALLKARTQPWSKVAPIVIEAIFEALDKTELFDCFVLSSMENNLVPQYEPLGREEHTLSIIRAEISVILCRAGFKKIVLLAKELNDGRINAARKVGLEATNLLEPAIAMANDQIGGYIGMAEVYKLFGINAQSRDFAERGLFELGNIQQSAAGQAMRSSSVFPPDMLAQAERQLRGYLK